MFPNISEQMFPDTSEQTFCLKTRPVILPLTIPNDTKQSSQHSNESNESFFTTNDVSRLSVPRHSDESFSSDKKLHITFINKLLEKW